MPRRTLLYILLLTSAAGTALPLSAVLFAGARPLTCAEIEEFLKTASVGARRGIPVGVTLPSRATLDDGSLKHDAAIQTVDIKALTYQTARGTEINFRDTWMFNVAGYELAKMLELNMVPPYVERRVAGTPASLSWWVNDTMMERDRVKKGIRPPDVTAWNQQMYAVRVFHELIGDRDFNATNILITKDWRIWMIDFTRAFRRYSTLRSPEDLTQTDRKLGANLSALTVNALRERLHRWLTTGEIDAVVARRDLLVARFEHRVRTYGESAVFYRLPQLHEPCGTGLE